MAFIFSETKYFSRKKRFSDFFSLCLLGLLWQSRGVMTSGSGSFDSTKCVYLQATSTRIQIFLKTQLFFYGFAFRPHVNDEKVTENGTFRRRSPKWNFSKTPFSCSRVDVFFLKTDKKCCVFKRKRMRVDKASVLVFIPAFYFKDLKPKS